MYNIRNENFVLLPSILLPNRTLLMNFQKDLSKSVMAFFLKLVVILINVSANASCLKFIRVWIFCKTMPFLKLIEKGQELVNAANLDQVGEEVDPENQKLDEECEEEDVQHTDKFVSFDSSPPTAPTGLFKRVELENVDELNKMTRELDVDQKFVIDQVITYIKHYKRAVLNTKDFPEQLKLIIFGGAGTGKSHVIHLIAQWVEYLMRDSGDNLDHPYIVRCAFSGCAAAEIHECWHGAIRGDALLPDV